MSIEWPPDEPIWIDVRAMLEAGGARLGDARNFVVCDIEPIYCIAVVGRPERELIDQGLALAKPRAEILAQNDNVEWLADQFPEREAERILMYRHSGSFPAPPSQPPVRQLTVDDPVDHLTARLADEMARVRQRTAVYAAFDGGRAVSFAYAHRETETLADTSIDTADGYRRRGYAWAACLHLFQHLADRGLRPTWASFESNEGSRALAAKLEFEPAGHIWSLNLPRS